LQSFEIVNKTPMYSKLKKEKHEDKQKQKDIFLNAEKI
jgi:hypothetical protein